MNSKNDQLAVDCRHLAGFACRCHEVLAGRLGRDLGDSEVPEIVLNFLLLILGLCSYQGNAME